MGCAATVRAGNSPIFFSPHRPSGSPPPNASHLGEDGGGFDELLSSTARYPKNKNGH